MPQSDAHGNLDDLGHRAREAVKRYNRDDDGDVGCLDEYESMIYVEHLIGSPVTQVFIVISLHYTSGNLAQHDHHLPITVTP